MMTKKKTLSMEQLKDLGLASFYGVIDGPKFRKYAEEQNAAGYEVLIEDSMKEDYNLLDNDPVIYNEETIRQNVQIIKEDDKNHSCYEEY